MSFRKVKRLAKNTQQHQYSDPRWTGPVGHALSQWGSVMGRGLGEAIPVLNMNRCDGKVPLLNCSQWTVKKRETVAVDADDAAPCSLPASVQSGRTLVPVGLQTFPISGVRGPNAQTGVGPGLQKGLPEWLPLLKN